MKLYLVKTFGGLKPAYDSDNERFKKIPFDVPLEYNVKVPRNPLFHKKFFAMLKMAYENQEEFRHPEHFRKSMMLRSGNSEEEQRCDGEIALVPKSIAFDNMEEYEFQEVYISVLDTIIEYFKWPRKGFEEEIAKFY